MRASTRSKASASCQRAVGSRGAVYRGAAAPRNQLQQRLQLLPNPNPNRQPLPWQEVKQVPACVQSGWPLFSDTGEDAVPKPKPKPKPKPIKLSLL